MSDYSEQPSAETLPKPSVPASPIKAPTPHIEKPIFQKPFCLTRCCPDYNERHREMMNMLDSSTIVKSGYLRKRSDHKGRWKRRWIVLRSHHLAIYKDSREYELKFIIKFEDISHIKWDTELKKSSPVIILGRGEKCRLYLTSDIKVEGIPLEEWKNTLERLILLHKPASCDVATRSSSTELFPISEEASVQTSENSNLYEPTISSF